MPVTLRTPLVLDFTMTAALVNPATTDITSYTALRPFVVMDIHNVCIASDAGGTATTERQALGGGGFVAICTAVACAVAGAVTRMTVGFVSTQYVVAATDVIRNTFTGPNSTLNARCWLTITPTPITGA